MTIPNTTIEEVKNPTGDIILYKVMPNKGYLLHNNANDWTEQEDKNTIHREYSSAPSTVPVDYNFDITVEIDGHIAYGDKEIYAIHKE